MAAEKVTLTGDALHGIDAHLIPRHLMAELPREVKLGRIRPKAPPPALKMAAYFRPHLATVPPPASTNWRQKAAAALARMYLNADYGCCVIAGKAHALGVWSANDLDHDPPGIVQATDAEILSQYQGICGAYGPPGGPGDNGCSITDVLDVMRSKGFQAGGRLYRIDNYLSVDWTDIELVKVVQAIFGASTIGINLPQAWTENAVWDVTDTPIVGGHDVTPIDYDDKGVYVSSWGRVYLITWKAFTSKIPTVIGRQRTWKWIEEYYVLLSPLWYGSDKLAPNGIDAKTLAADLQKLTSGVLPDVGPTPPLPPQPPSPPLPPSPPVPPTPGPDVNPIQNLVDGLIAQLESAIQADKSHPFIDRILLSGLQTLQHAWDSLFATNTAAAITPSQFKALADAILGVAATLFAGKPEIVAIIAAIKLAIDTFLQPQAAPLLTWKCA